MYLFVLGILGVLGVPIYEWQQVKDSRGLLPNQRGGHSAVVIGRLLYIFGGCNEYMQCFNDLHSFDTSTKTWTRLNSTGTPPSPRGGHSAVLIGTRMLVFGGSSQSFHYNDLHEYDAVNDHWKILFPEGQKPLGRSNHAADLDEETHMVVFGGYSQKGYLNDVWIYTPYLNKWSKYEASGELPSPRELSSMNIVGRQAYVYGGFHEGGVSTELYSLNLELMVWKIVQDGGFLPEGREGHLSLRIGDFLFVYGGCDFGLDTCYNRLYVLDLVTMWWTKLENNPPLPHPLERLAGGNVAGHIYIFGGCFLNSPCYNSMYLINTGVACPYNCSDRGACLGDLCVCQQGYIGNECEIKTKCQEDCLGRGLCTWSAKCDCYPGYKGEYCEYTVGCPNNCTSQTAGICQVNGECLCNKGYSEPSCKCECVHGYCYSEGCYCEYGWKGDKCDIPETQEKPVSQKVSSGARSYTQKSSFCSKKCVHGTCVSDKCECYEGFEGQFCNTTQKAKESKQTCECYNGVCKNNTCYCWPGYTDKACSTKVSGVSWTWTAVLGALSLGVGLALGVLFYYSQNKRKESEELPLIQ